MPELPDIVVYIEALEQRIQDQRLMRVQIATPFLLRTAVPPITSVEGRKVVQLRRLGKRICIGLEDDLWLVLHLMIAGRLHWHEGQSKVSPGKASPIKLSSSPKNRGLAAFQFSNAHSPTRGYQGMVGRLQDGTLFLTEAGTRKRASLHLVAGEASLQRLDPGGERCKATMRAKTNVIVKLISPSQACEACEVHVARIGLERCSGKRRRLEVTTLVWSSIVLDGVRVGFVDRT